MAIDLSNVTAISIPEGNVIEISINGTTVWSAGPSPYIWTTIDNTQRAMGSASSFTTVTEFATIPSNAVKLKLTLSYSQNPNNYSFYETNVNTLSGSTVANYLSHKPTSLVIPLDGSTYLLAVRYRVGTSSSDSYQHYWTLEVSNDNKLSLIREYTSSTTTGSARGLYPFYIDKIEAAIPNPDYQA